MKKLLVLTFIFTLCSCSVGSVVLLKPTVVVNESQNNYEYIYGLETQNINSNIWVTIYGGYFYSAGKSVNQSDLITGAFSKSGFIKLIELKEDLIDQALVVNYGKFGRRTVGLRYTIEVTIQLVSAKMNALVSTCTA